MDNRLFKKTLLLNGYCETENLILALVVLFGVYIVSSLHDCSSETFREQVSLLFKILVTQKSNLRILIWPLGEASGNHIERASSPFISYLRR